MGSVNEDVLAESERQTAQWGVQNHPDGTGAWWRDEADKARASCNLAAAAGFLTWRHILTEETFEAFAESDASKLRDELIQVAAVALNWADAIDRRDA